MDNYVVSARKYRPASFADVIGQQAITNTLLRSISSGKLAGAYLFCGPRGVGKTTCARIFAKTINCLNRKPNGEACDECASCVSFNEGRSINVQELNAAANNGVDDVRAIIDQVSIPPQLGKYKVMILDEVHMLTPNGSNALLKTLEEPPSYVIFILATTEKHKIIPTILSRCQIYDFNRMSIDDIISNLKLVAAGEHVEFDEAALNIIAQKADGGMRDSLSIFDQVASFGDGHVTYDNVLRCLNVLDYEYYFRVTDALVAHDVTQALLLCNEVLTKGFNGGTFMGGLASHFRDLLMSRHPETTALLDVADSVRQRYAEQAARCTERFLYRAIKICDKVSNEHKVSLNKRLSVEIALIEASQLDTPDEIAGRGPAQTLKPIFSAQAPQPVAQPTPQQAPKPAEQPAVQPKPAPAPTPAEKEPVQRVSAKDGVAVDIGAIASLLDGPSLAMVARNDRTTPQPAADAASPTPVQKGSVDNEPLGPLNADTLQRCWERYIATVPADAKAMQQRLKAAQVDCEGTDTVVLYTKNDIAKAAIEKSLADIAAYLNQAYGRQDIKVEVRVVAGTQKEAVSAPELYAKLVQQNGELATLVKELSLVVD